MKAEEKVWVSLGRVAYSLFLSLTQTHTHTNTHSQKHTRTQTLTHAHPLWPNHGLQAIGTVTRVLNVLMGWNNLFGRILTSRPLRRKNLWQGIFIPSVTDRVWTLYKFEQTLRDKSGSEVHTWLNPVDQVCVKYISWTFLNSVGCHTQRGGIGRINSLYNLSPSLRGSFHIRLS